MTDTTEQAWTARRARHEAILVEVAQEESGAVEADIADTASALDMRSGLQIADSVLATFARRYGIARLALFGSVLRGDFDKNSDVDILVEFEPGHTPGLFALTAMERELEATIGRTVDLRTSHDLSRYFTDDVVASARMVYAA